MAELTARATALVLTDLGAAMAVVALQYFVEAHDYVMQVVAAVAAAQVTQALPELPVSVAARAKVVAEDLDHQDLHNLVAHHPLDLAVEVEVEVRVLHQIRDQVSQAAEEIIQLRA